MALYASGGFDATGKRLNRLSVSVLQGSVLRIRAHSPTLRAEGVMTILDPTVLGDADALFPAAEKGARPWRISSIHPCRAE
jgi:hypothetical protein